MKIYHGKSFRQREFNAWADTVDVGSEIALRVANMKQARQRIRNYANGREISFLSAKKGILTMRLNW